MSVNARFMHLIIGLLDYKRSSGMHSMNFTAAFSIISTNGVAFRRRISQKHNASPEISKNELLDEVLAAIENAPTSSGEVCASYIQNLCRDGNIGGACPVLKIFESKGIFLKPDIYNLLLRRASERNDIDLSCVVFKHLLLSCNSLSVKSYLNFAKAFTKVRDNVQLLKFVDGLSEQKFPKTIVVNRLISAFGKCGQSDKALLIFDHYRKKDNVIDLITYNTILDILGSIRHVDEMLHEYKSMEKDGISPDVISYNTLINRLGKVGRSDLCLLYFKQMVDAGIEPDLHTYAAMIETFGRLGSVEESLRFFEQMKLKQIRPSIYVYRSLMHNLNKVGKIKLAMALQEEMNLRSSSLAAPEDFKSKRKHERFRDSQRSL